MKLKYLMELSLLKCIKNGNKKFPIPNKNIKQFYIDYIINDEFYYIKNNYKQVNINIIKNILKKYI